MKMHSIVLNFRDALAILGGLVIFSRYTPWKWDDKIFSAAESALSKVKSLLPSKEEEK